MGELPSDHRKQDGAPVPQLDYGSCAANGNLNFNWLLILAPPVVLDYVVVHELCHRREMNHSQAFWKEVEKILPDYRERQKWLKDNGWRLMEEGF